ncbi:hypothetical protein BsWGS_25228 [Bradybaena similaris]
MAAVKSRPFLLNLRAMFYMVTPKETSFEKLEDVPNFVDEAIPYFIVMVVLECIVLKLQGKEIPRINDGINSMSHGLLSQMHALLFRSIELMAYVWLYENWHLIDLPWDNPWTWFIGFIAVDFLYYWFHRFSHESNIVWASHQVHHSSEEYNLTTALRQSLMQKYYSMLLNFPMAFFIPPSVFYVHQQFNLLYQFWIHTEVIHSLGPLEYILNTPSHHRVHHGRNPYCIDKNYGGTLIIWDKIFNTFEAEGEQVVYGLVHPNQFWNPLYGQFHHYLYIFGLVRSQQGLENKVSAVVKGPGWEPGKPWRGLFTDLPEVEQPVRKYNSELPLWATLYVLCHFILIIVCYGMLAPYKKQLTATSGVGCVVYFVYSLTVFGALFDNKKYSSLLEIMRCLFFLTIDFYIKGHLMFEISFALVLDIVFILSALLWGTLTFIQYDIQLIKKRQV